MSRIAFFNIPATGHIYPTLPVVQELLRRGHQVDYFLSEMKRELIESTGARFIPVPNYTDHEIPTSPRTMLHFAELVLRQTKRYLPELVHLFQQERYDAVVHDTVCAWARIGCQATQTHAITAVTPFAMTRELAGGIATPFEIARTVASGIPAWLRLNRSARELKKAYGPLSLSLFDVMTNYADTNIVFTSRELQPGSNDFDERFRFVGASFKQTDSQPMDFEISAGKPVVYVSLGTVVDNTPDFYRTCLEALQDLDAQFIMSIGRKVEPAALGTVPDNFLIYPFVPQIDVLKLADVFVSHGGLASISESLYHGVPLVLCPQTAEQAFNARAVRDKEAGVYLGTGVPSPTQLGQAVRQVLGNSQLKRNAVRLGDSLRDAGGPSAAADVILEVAASEPPQRQPAVAVRSS